MNKYETMFVFSTAKGEEGVTALTEKFSALVAANGTIESCEPFGANGGVRTLAYEIDDEKTGAYILMNYEGEAGLPAEIDRVAKITDGVLRVITIRK